MNANKSDLAGYHAAMVWLYDNRPHMVEYIAALGKPRQSAACPRAMVVANKTDMKPVLYVNDEFLQEIGPAQAAGVLAHEWRHVLLGHLKEVANPKPEWKLKPALVDAHEVIINDSLELSGYELPDDVVRGENRGGKFYGYWDTNEAYPPVEEWYLEQMQNPDDSNGEGEESSESGDSENESASGGSSSSSGGSSSGEPNSNSSNNSGGSDENSTDEPNSDGASDESSNGNDAEDSETNDDDSPEPSNGNISEDDLSSDGCTTKVFVEDENGELQDISDGELEDFIDKLNDIMQEVIEANPMPEDEKPSTQELDAMDQDVAQAIDPSRGGSWQKAGNSFSEVQKILTGGKLNLGWVRLLQKINPEVGKEDGGLNARASYNWARPRRSTSLIAGVNLPTPGAPRGEGVGTTKKPTALIALDQSGSIDSRLAEVMRDMTQSIPDEHIEAICYTFSTNIVPFDHKAKSNRIASGGTDFSCIHLEALEIQKRTGEYPYVMCLTDGEAWFGGWQGYGSAPSKAILDEKWLWIDVLTEDNDYAFKTSGYPQVLAQKNISALPYDRSKI